MRYLLTLLLLTLGLQAAPWSPATVDGFTPSLMRGLAEYYEFNETVDGSAPTGSVAGVVLTDVNTLPRTSSGKLDYGLNFAQGGTARLTSSDALFAFTNNFTIAYWVLTYWTNAGGTVYHHHLTKDAGGANNRGWEFYYELAAGARTLAFACSSNGLATGKVTLSKNIELTNQWFFVCGSVSNSTMRFYTNGVLAATGTLAGNVTVSTNLFCVGDIGNSGTATLINDGFFDETGFWNRALTQSEITQLYNATKARRFPFNSGP